MAFDLIRPSLDALPGYIDALRRGWSPDNVRGKLAADEQLVKIEQDPNGFVEGLEDPEARAGPVLLPDGSTVERLPGFVRWMWDDGFCGSLGFRWRPGTADLPTHVLGHVGYAVPPWRRGQGYARGLGLMLPLAKAQGLAYVELTTDPDNLPSQKVILANGGVLVERFIKPSAYGATEGMRFRIAL